jgi:Tfp pilus assembly protein PilF
VRPTGRAAGYSRQWLRALATLAAAVGLLAGCSNSGPPASVGALLGAGSVAFRQGDYNAALQLFLQAVRRAPTNALAHYDLATTYQAQHLRRQALAQYQAALRFDPHMAPALFNLATLYSDGVPELAIFYYRVLISMHPNSPTAYLNLGLLEARRGESGQAGVDLRQAIRLDPGLRNRIPHWAIADLALPPPHRPARPTATESGSP